MTEVHDADVRRHVIGMTTIDVADDREVAIDSRVDEETDLGVGTDLGDNVLALEAVIVRKVVDPTIHEEVRTLSEPHPMIQN